MPNNEGFIKRTQIKMFLLLQALWNYLIDTGNVIGALGEDEADYISADLLEYLGWCLSLL